MKKKMTLPELIDALVAGQQELDQLMYDESSKPQLGKPCTAKEIALAESALGKPLPPSYKAFLELHNGWKDFDGEAKLLAAEDFKSLWVKARVKALSDLFAETDDEDPFAHGAIPIMLGKGVPNYLVIDPRKVRPNGEMDFVSFDLTGEEDRFKDFTAYLQDFLSVTLDAIETEKEGVSDEDEEDAEED